MPLGPQYPSLGSASLHIDFSSHLSPVLVTFHRVKNHGGKKGFSFPTVSTEVQNYTSWSHAYFRINRDKDNEMFQLPGLIMESLLGLVERVRVINFREPQSLRLMRGNENCLILTCASEKNIIGKASLTQKPIYWKGSLKTILSLSWGITVAIILCAHLRVPKAFLLDTWDS